jgi:RNA methyltransferase, RsmE family
VTLPVFLAEDLDPDASTLLPGARAHLGGVEGRHAAVVRRLTPGEALDVVDGHGLRLTCSVEGASKVGLDLVVDSVLREQEPRPRLVLVQALAKGGRDEQAVETATEVGIDEVVPWQSDRSIVRWNAQKAARGVDKWREVARAAAKQSRRARVPGVCGVLDSRGLVAWVRDLIDEGGVCLVCHEEAEGTLTALLRDDRESLMQASRVAVVVGPEGGISPDELESMRDAGGQVVLLGPHVLRSSTAGPAACILIGAALGRW